MSEDKTATAEPTQAEVEAPFGESLENFFKTPEPAEPATESTPEPQTQAQKDSTDEPTDEPAEDDDATTSDPVAEKSKSKKKGSSRPFNVEAKIKGLEVAPLHPRFRQFGRLPLVDASQNVFHLPPILQQPLKPWNPPLPETPARTRRTLS